MVEPSPGSGEKENTPPVVTIPVAEFEAPSQKSERTYVGSSKAITVTF